MENWLGAVRVVHQQQVLGFDLSWYAFVSIQKPDAKSDTSRSSLFTQRRQARKDLLCIGLASLAPLRENLSGKTWGHPKPCLISGPRARRVKNRQQNTNQTAYCLLPTAYCLLPTWPPPSGDGWLVVFRSQLAMHGDLTIRQFNQAIDFGQHSTHAG